MRIARDEKGSFLIPDATTKQFLGKRESWQWLYISHDHTSKASAKGASENLDMNWSNFNYCESQNESVCVMCEKLPVYLCEKLITTEETTGYVQKCILFCSK